jgi:hypothetical protein
MRRFAPKRMGDYTQKGGGIRSRWVIGDCGGCSSRTNEEQPLPARRRRVRSFSRGGFRGDGSG